MQAEMAVMLNDAKLALEHDADGLVFGILTEGGSIGLGRNTMVSVVTCLVVVIVSDALLGAFFVQYGL